MRTIVLAAGWLVGFLYLCRRQRRYYRWMPTVSQTHGVLGMGAAIASTQVWIHVTPPVQLRTTNIYSLSLNFVDMELLGPNSATFGAASAAFSINNALIAVLGQPSLTVIFNPTGGGLITGAPYMLISNNISAYTEFSSEM